MKIAIISPFYSPEGISDYSEQLYLPMLNKGNELTVFANKDISNRTAEDSEFIKRTWVKGELQFEETISEIIKGGFDLCHIQYHSEAFFSVKGLDNIISNLAKNNITVFVTLHAVRGKGFDFIKSSSQLSKAKKIFIHNEEDFKYASTFLENVYYFSHPRVAYPFRNNIKVRNKLGLNESFPILATHGIFNVNKNVITILNSVIELKDDYPNILFLFLNAVVSNNAYGLAEYNKALEFVKENKLENNVRFFPEFLDISQIILLLQSADIAVLAYSESGESASGAISKCLAANIPTIVSDVKAFNEFEDEVLRMKRITAQSISKSVKDLLENSKLKKSLVNATKKFIDANTFEKKSAELLKIYSSIGLGFRA